MYHSMVYGDHRRFHGPHCRMLPVRRWFEVEVQLQSLQVVTGSALNRVLRKGSGMGVDTIFAHISCRMKSWLVTRRSARRRAGIIESAHLADRPHLYTTR